MDYLNRVPDVEPEDKMTVFLTALAAERKRSVELKLKLNAVMEEALKNSDYPLIKAELLYAQNNELMFYEEIKKLALERDSKGQYLPVEVKVKTFKRVMLSTLDKITEWCLKNLPTAMHVDEVILADAVKIGVVPSEIGWIEEEKRAQVASDLSKYG